MLIDALTESLPTPIRSAEVAAKRCRLAATAEDPITGLPEALAEFRENNNPEALAEFRENKHFNRDLSTKKKA
jgi:hypothetical protein